MGFWDSIAGLDPEQATLLSTIILVCGGGIGIIMGSWLFGGRVNDLRSALEKSRAAVEEYNDTISKKLLEMDEQMSATMEALNHLRSGMSDLRDEAQSQGNQLRNALKRHWYSIRDEIQKAAASPQIHGRTRTRYARFTNNEISALLDAMEMDQTIGQRLGSFRNAVELWVWHRNGRPQLTEADVQRMREIAIQTIPHYRPD